MGTVKLLALVNITMAVILVGWARRKLKITVWRVALPITGAVVLLLLLPGRLAFKGELDRAESSQLLFWEEGEHATVKVVTVRNPSEKGMTIDGYLIGIDRAWRREITQKQILLAHLPMVLRPDSRHTLNIGLGTATTLASLASYSQLTRLDCVEISPAVIRGAQFFADGAVLNDPRTHVTVGDAVRFLVLGTALYDIVISDGKQNPEYSGNSAMLSTEFFEHALRRLSPDGLMVQWIPIGFPPRAFQVILKTFSSVFPTVGVYYYPPETIILVGSRRPLPSATELAPPSFASTQPIDDLAPYHYHAEQALANARLVGERGLAQVLRDVETNTWDHPILEFIPSRQFDLQSLPQYRYENLLLLQQAGGRDAPGNVRPPTSMAWLQLGYLELFQTGRAEAIRPYCLRAVAADPGDSLAHACLRNIEAGFGALMATGR